MDAHILYTDGMVYMVVLQCSTCSTGSQRLWSHDTWGHTLKAARSLLVAYSFLASLSLLGEKWKSISLARNQIIYGRTTALASERRSPAGDLLGSPLMAGGSPR